VRSCVRTASVTSSSFANRRVRWVFTLHTWMHICKFRVFPPTFHRLLQSAAEESGLHYSIAVKTACPLVLIYMLLCHTTYTNSVPSEVVAKDGICICGISAIYVAVICLPYWLQHYSTLSALHDVVGRPERYSSKTLVLPLWKFPSTGTPCFA